MVHQVTLSTKPGVSVRGVSKSYGTVKAVTDVTLGLDNGVTILLGRNGAGKSTLSRIVVGVEPPDSGEILRHGDPVVDGPSRRYHLGRTGWLPQSFSTLGSLTVNQSVTHAGWLKNLGREALSPAVTVALDATNLSASRSRRVNQLSGGMLRRLGIAQAIVSNPDLLVLDEPTVGLDPEQRDAFHTLVRQLAVDKAVLLSTHLLEDVVALGDRTVILDQGSVRFDGTTAALMARGGGGDAAIRLRSGFLAVLAADEH